MTEVSKLDRYKAQLAEMSDRTMGGISFLNPSQAHEFEASGRIPVRFGMNAEGDAIKLSEFSWGAPSSGSGVNPSKALFDKVVTKEALWYLYKRQDICRRGVDRPADDALRYPITFKVVDDKGNPVESTVTATLKQTFADLHLRTKLSTAYKSMRLFGLGTLVYGFMDGKKLNTPVTQSYGIEYIRPFWDIDLKEIKQYKAGPFKGSPEFYVYKMKDANGKPYDMPVHASRVQRVSSDNSFYGIGTGEPLYNMMQGLANVDWAAMETYFQIASPILVVTWEGSLIPPSTEILDKIEDEAEIIHITKRWIMPDKYKVEWVGPKSTITDPNKWWDPMLTRLSAGWGVPKAILVGVEAGQKLSHESTIQEYYGDIASTQNTFLETLLKEMIDYMIEVGALKADIDTNLLDLGWKSLWEPSDKEVTEMELNRSLTAERMVKNQMASPEEGYAYITTGKYPDRTTLGTPVIGEIQETPEPMAFGAPPVEGVSQNMSRNQRAHNPMIQLDLRARDFNRIMEPITISLIDKDITPKVARKMLKAHLVTLREDTKTHALADLHRNMPSIVREQVSGIPPEWDDDIDAEMKRIEEFYERIIVDAEKVEPTQQ